MMTGHIREFVSRTRYILLSATITFLFSYYFSEQTIYILVGPLVRVSDFSFVEDNHDIQQGHRLISTELTEAFHTHLLSSAAITLWTLLPITVYQL